MVDRLAEDHEHARLLAESLAELPGLSVDLEAVQTNMVYAEVIEGSAESGAELAGETRAPPRAWSPPWTGAECRINAVGERRVRFVTHVGIDRARHTTDYPSDARVATLSGERTMRAVEPERRTRSNDHRRVRRERE